MNEVFNIKRFGTYAFRSWSVYAKKYLVTTAVFAGLMILMLVVSRIFDSRLAAGDIRDISKFWLSPLFVIYLLSVTFMTMKPLKSRHTLVMENTLPVSATEKFLFVVLNSTVVAAAVYALALLVATLFGLALFDMVSFGDYFYYFSGDRWHALILLLPVQAAVIFAGTLERRNHIVSCIAVAGVWLAATLVLVALPPWISVRFDTAVDYGPTFILGKAEVASELSRVDITGYGRLFKGTAAESVAYCVSILMTVVLLVCAWFNFRERSAK